MSLGTKLLEEKQIKNKIKEMIMELIHCRGGAWAVTQKAHGNECLFHCSVFQTAFYSQPGLFSFCYFRHINIGSRFQAEIPDLQDRSSLENYEHPASLVWKPWGDITTNKETQKRGMLTIFFFFILRLISSCSSVQMNFLIWRTVKFLKFHFQ